MSKKHDFVSIGDITTDAFIRLKDASVHCDVDKENCQLCVSFGDKIPYEHVDVIPAVGNSPNAAVSAARLGLNSALVANMGDDENGRTCLESLKKDHVDTEFITVQEGMPTNYHYVLWYEDERTILVKHQDFKYKLPDLDNPKWIYLSSMGESSAGYHDEIANFVHSHPEVKLAFQPGTFQMILGVEKLKKIYQRTEVFFCNKNEAQRILNLKEDDIKKLLTALRALGPKIAVITDGPKGAYSDDGEKVLFMPTYPDEKPPVDRTGAGDAFASTVTAALALGKTLEEALTWGPINSMSVVQYVGAQRGLLTQEKIEEYLKKAPENFKPEQI